MVTEGLRELAEHAVDRALRGLPQAKRRRLEADNHLVCGLLADMAAAVGQLAHLPDELGEAVADVVFAGEHGELQPLREKVMKAALKNLVARVVRRTEIGQLDTVLTALSVAAVANCRDINQHPTVRTACLIPLQEQVATTVIADVLVDAARP